MRWRIPLLFALIALVAVSCDQQPVAPTNEQANQAPEFKVERLVSDADIDYDWYAPLECPDELVQQHGKVRYTQTQTTLPSGNVLLHWDLDYDAYPPPTAEGLSSGRTYTLEKATYSGHVTERGSPVPGSQNESWIEWYADGDGNQLKVTTKVRFLVDEDWNFKHERVEIDCK